MRFGVVVLFWSGVLVAASFGQAPSRAVQMRDGGTREVLESIYIPPLTGAPFNAVLVTEWSRPMGNGGSVTVVNHRRIARDTAGRIYEERWLLVPKGSKIQSQMNYTQIADPAEHTLYNCATYTKVCHLEAYRGSTNTAYKPAVGASGELPDGSGYHLHEDLGSSTAAGVNTTGYRETTTLNPGVLGNDQPMVTIREFWYSPQLGINLISKLDTPQTGKQTFTVVELSTSEPDPGFFALPEGYTVVDEPRPGRPPQ